MATGPNGKQIETRGGRRPGSGRPAKGTSETIKAAVVKAIRLHEKKTGVPFWTRLANIATDGERDMDSVRAYQTILDHLVAKESDSTVNVNRQNDGPAIMLPEQMEDTAAELKRTA